MKIDMPSNKETLPNHLIIFKQIYLTNRWISNRYYHSPSDAVLSYSGHPFVCVWVHMVGGVLLPRQGIQSVYSKPCWPGVISVEDFYRYQYRRYIKHGLCPSPYWNEQMVLIKTSKATYIPEEGQMLNWLKHCD